MQQSGQPDSAASQASSQRRTCFGGDNRAYTVIGGKYAEIVGCSEEQKAAFMDRHSHSNEWARR